MFQETAESVEYVCLSKTKPNKNEPFYSTFK